MRPPDDGFPAFVHRSQRQANIGMEQQLVAEMVGVLQTLVQAPSVNGVHTEKATVLALAREAQRLGLDHTLHSLDEERPNLVVSVGEGEPSFLFIAHSDTVGTGQEELWKHPPFAGVVEDGILYARGACDNKAGMVCGLYTLKRLADTIAKSDDRYRKLGKVQLAIVADEESGACSKIGMRYLLDENLVGGKGAIYGYPGTRVTIGHRGLLRFTIEVHGEPVHVGSSEWTKGIKGANATMALVDILSRMEKHEWPLDEHDSFPGLNFVCTPGTLISGGTYESVVPNYAQTLVDMRPMPDTNVENIIATVEKIISDVITERNAKIGSDKLNGAMKIKARLPAVFIPKDHPLATSCVKAVEKVLNETPDVGGCGPANEGYMLIEKGIPTICGFGPKGGAPHAPNEWVEVASLGSTVDIYYDIVCRYLDL